MTNVFEIGNLQNDRNERFRTPGAENNRMEDKFCNELISNHLKMIHHVAAYSLPGIVLQSALYEFRHPQSHRD